MELNPSHPIFERLSSLDLEKEVDAVSNYAHLLHGQALIAEGSSVPDPSDFAKRVAELMVR